LAQQIAGDASEGGHIFWGMVLLDTYEEHRWANVFPGNATFTARTFTKMITIAFAIMLTNAGQCAEVPSRWYDAGRERRWDDPHR
jgi:hypothetical protein